MMIQREGLRLDLNRFMIYDLRFENVNTQNSSNFEEGEAR